MIHRSKLSCDFENLSTWDCSLASRLCLTWVSTWRQSPSYLYLISNSQSNLGYLILSGKPYFITVTTPDLLKDTIYWIMKRYLNITVSHKRLRLIFLLICHDWHRFRNQWAGDISQVVYTSQQTLQTSQQLYIGIVWCNIKMSLSFEIASEASLWYSWKVWPFSSPRQKPQSVILWKRRIRVSWWEAI